MRVLLIEPPFHRFMGLYRHYYPLGLAYIAGALALHGHDVQVYDAEHDPETIPRTYLETSQTYAKYLDAVQNRHHPVWSEIKRHVSKFKPDIVGISALSVKVPSALRIASMCREACGDVPVVVGGEHPCVRPEDLLEDENVDFAVRGEGEQTMCELLDIIKSRGRLEEVDGLSFKNNGRICHNKGRALIEDLDSLPIPSRDRLAHTGKYRPVDFGLVMGSRGCLYRCAFCPNQNIWGRRVRFRSTGGVLSEIRIVKESYSTDYFSFRDYSFSVNRQWTTDFCKMVMQEKLDIEWECTTRPDLLDENMVSLMKQAGCATIRVGVESGSERILNEIRKDLSLEEVRKMARILHRHRLYWAAYFMFGLPSETEEDIDKTFSFIDEIDPPFVTMARYTPLPGTEMYDKLVSEGKIRESEVDWGQWGNQWLQTGFTKGISRERFPEIMEEIAKRVDEHNTRHKPEKAHPLLRLNS